MDTGLTLNHNYSRVCCELHVFILGFGRPYIQVFDTNRFAIKVCDRR